MKFATEEQLSEEDRSMLNKPDRNDLSLINPLEPQSLRDMLDRRILTQLRGEGDNGLYGKQGDKDRYILPRGASR